MTRFDDLEVGDLFVLERENGSDVYRKLGDLQALRTMYANDNTWIPYGRGERVNLDLETPVKQIRVMVREFKTGEVVKAVPERGSRPAGIDDVLRALEAMPEEQRRAVIEQLKRV